MPADNAPRVSILIPNYNNGRGSAADGKFDMIGELLRSLEATLRDDPTPFEIIIYDDGSTDDSLATLREWSKKRWRDGRPFLDLIEAEHCGVLSKNANILSRRARGDILVRLDGDVACLTPQWVSKLCQVFDTDSPRLGVVGPKQLSPQHRILSYGDWILHPNSYSHVAFGLPREAVKFPMEVDHVMGCFYCCRRKVYEDLGGYDEDFLRGQTIDFGLRVRLAGWFCIAVPHIEFVHNHCLRKERSTRADTMEGINYSLDVFTRKWGFHRLAADLDEVRRRYAGTPLLWNKQVFGSTEQANTAPATPLRIEQTEWARYAQNDAFRLQIDFEVSLTLDVLRQVGTPEAGLVVVHIGCGTGLIPHLLASRGVPCVGIDRQRVNIDFARNCTARQKYPSAAPRYEAMANSREFPLADSTVHLLIMFWQMERHPNPVALLRECRRIVAPGKYMLLTSQRKPAQVPDPSEPATLREKLTEHRYTWKELLTQIDASGGWQFQIDPQKDDTRHDMVIAVQRKEAWIEPNYGSGLPERRQTCVRVAG